MNAPSNTKFFPLKIQERLSGRRVNRLGGPYTCTEKL